MRSTSFQISPECVSALRGLYRFARTMNGGVRPPQVSSIAVDKDGTAWAQGQSALAVAETGQQFPVRLRLSVESLAAFLYIVGSGGAPSARFEHPGRLFIGKRSIVVTEPDALPTMPILAPTLEFFLSGSALTGIIKAAKEWSATDVMFVGENGRIQALVYATDCDRGDPDRRNACQFEEAVEGHGNGPAVAFFNPRALEALLVAGDYSVEIAPNPATPLMGFARFLSLSARFEFVLPCRICQVESPSNFVQGWLARSLMGLSAANADDKRKGTKSRTDEWYTPSWLVSAVRDVLGEIDLDPCSSDLAQRTVQAERYFTIQRDGLAQHWHGRVFGNLPFSAMLPFVEKTVQHYEAGEVSEAILLTRSGTSTRWFHKALGACSAICFFARPIAFENPSSGRTVSAPFDSAMLYFGRDAAKFQRRFAEFGAVIMLESKPAPKAAA